MCVFMTLCAYIYTCACVSAHVYVVLCTHAHMHVYIVNYTYFINLFVQHFEELNL